MEKTFLLSGNNLADIVNWLKEGYFVCLHDSSKKNARQVYYSKDSSEAEIIFVDMVRMKMNGRGT
jgi:hypothetical protein